MSNTQDLGTYNYQVKNSGIRLKSTEPLVVASTATFSGTTTFTGAVTLSGGTTFSGAETVTASSDNAFAVGVNGTTNPAFNVDTNATSAATGLNVVSAAAGSGVTLAVTSSGSNDGLSINTKGSGVLFLNATNTVVTGAGSNSFAVGANGSTNPVLNVDSSTASVATGLQVKGAAAGSAVTVSVLSSGGAEALVLQAKTTTNKLTLNDTLAAATNPLLIGNATDVTTGAVTDAYTAGVRLTPVLNGSNTVTRLNYIDVNQPTGAATVTNAAVMRFDAAAGTHKAVDGATTKTTPGGVDAWVKVNVNGTLYYMPAYTSKTA